MSWLYLLLAGITENGLAYWIKEDGAILGESKSHGHCRRDFLYDD